MFISLLNKLAISSSVILGEHALQTYMYERSFTKVKDQSYDTLQKGVGDTGSWKSKRIVLDVVQME